MKYTFFLLGILWSVPAMAEKLALLIGIDDYTASTLPRLGGRLEHRGWTDLKGAANDVRILHQMLVRDYGFDARNVLTLTNQQATRSAILQLMENHLVRRARRGDIVFYYFAGHGSQVPNAVSDEPDRLDESIVPADSRLGAADIRDKELRPLFNRLLDRGAHLTLLLDHCHSGSAFRGGARPRGIRRALPIRDAAAYGPRPEERGALVLASTQDLDAAWETRGDDGLMHGAFTWAWIRALRDGAAGEPAQETFLRAHARLRAETPYQAPVMLGPAKARSRPFLSVLIRPIRDVIGVERVDRDGTAVLQGGWANGLSVGTVLRGRDSELRITQLAGPGRSLARLETGTVASGALVEPERRRRTWHTLESATPTPFHLALQRDKTKELVHNGTAIGGETYSVVLRPSRIPGAQPRYYYVLVIDSRGQSFLVFPRSGSVENRFVRGDSEIRLGDASTFVITPPYGADTYVLLSTDEPLPNPAVLTWNGLRAILPASRWSIERVTFQSVPPRR